MQYLYSVYWALTTLTTVGYGDITPTNNAERVFSLFALLTGALVFGYMLSSIGDLLRNVDKNMQRLVDESALTRNEITDALRREIRLLARTIAATGDGS